MIAPRLLLIAFGLLAALAHAQTDACRQILMASDELRQLYARGDGMGVTVPAVPQVLEGLTAARVHGVAVRKLEAHGLLDRATTAQWLDVNVNVGDTQFAMILSLRRWTNDLGYGLPGQITVWGLGGGYHAGSAERVLARVAQHVDEFIALYARAQRVGNCCSFSVF